MKEIEIDFEALKRLDMEVISGPTDPEEDRAFSEHLKKLREKEARRKNARPSPLSAKKVKAAAK